MSDTHPPSKERGEYGRNSLFPAADFLSLRRKELMRALVPSRPDHSVVDDGKTTSAEFARGTMGTYAVDLCATVTSVLGAKGCAESQTNRHAYICVYGLIIKA